MTSTQRKISELLEQMYETASRPDSPPFAFSEHSVSPGNGAVVLQGRDGLAVERIAACLNMAFRNNFAWQKVRPVPVSYHERRNAITHPSREGGQWRASPKDPSNKIMIDVGFFADPAHFQKLEECAQRLSPPPVGRELSMSRA